MTDPNNRTVEAEIDFNSDGSAYFSWAVYVDTSEVCDDSILEYLNEHYDDMLFEAEHDKHRQRAEEAYESWER